MEKINLLSIKVSTGSYKEFVETILEAAELKESQYTCIANVHMLVEAYHSNDFEKIVSNANIITPDGKPLSWALWMLYGIRQVRVAGMDLLPDLLLRAEQKKIPVFFYGGEPSVLDRTLQYIGKKYPHLTVSGAYSPPFRKLSIQEDEAVIRMINDSGAGLVFVVLGCPKQERWMASMKGKIHAVMVGVGGALPVMIGEQRRAPKWMQVAGMEWLFRLLQEPSRLFKRYALTNSLFLYLLFKAYLRQRIFNPGISSRDFNRQ